MAEPLPPFAALVAGTLIVRLKVAPRAAKTAFGGLLVDGDGESWLKLSVTAAPEAGKANAAVIKHLAKAWGLPKGALSLRRGETDRWKVIEIAVGADQAWQSIQTWWQANSRPA
ncbi:MAG: DUF167 domain-containing protein [Magnetovibrionaceae bacterium]